MSSEVKNFIRKIIFTVIAFAALCIFCFDMFGSTGNSHFGFLALLFPCCRPPISRNKIFHDFKHYLSLLRNPVRKGGISFCYPIFIVN